MRRDGPHHHPCARCLVETECSGDLERNHDGWPEVVCPDYDMRNHGDFYCEDCRAFIDNFDPPDDDGEAFRGGEAAAYAWEQQLEARRLK